MSDFGWIVEIAPGADLSMPERWVWVDVTAYLRDDDIQINYGRSDGWSQPGTTSCDLRLDNSDGRFSPRNPNGPWYGILNLNTPLRVRYPGDNVRFLGYVSAWPPRWGGSKEDATVPVSAAGVMRRLSQGEKPLRSALYRQIVSYSPVAYWPMEDAEHATRAATPVQGNRSARTVNLDFAGTEGPPGSESLPTINTGDSGDEAKFVAFTPKRPGTGAWHVEMVFKLDSAPENDTYSPMFRVGSANGTVTEWRIGVNDENLRVRGYDKSSTLLIDAPVQATNFFGHWVRIALAAEQRGSSFHWLLRWYPIGANGTILDGDHAGIVGDITHVSSPFGVGVNGGSFGHVAVFDKYNYDAFADADTGHAAELAGHRIERLCAEENVLFTVTSDHTDTARMGPQAADSLLSLLQSCADADGGVLYELEGGLSYQSRLQRMNQPVVFTLEETAGQLLAAPEPTDDDQQLRNDMTAGRVNGSSSRVIDDGNVDRHGRYDSSISVNVFDDSPLTDIAAWAVHLGTADEMRWPQISTSMQLESALVPDWLHFGFGNRLRLYHDIAQLPGIEVDVLVDGWTETLSPYRWDVQLNTVPAKPWDVMVLEHQGRLDTAGSVVASSIGDPEPPKTANPAFEENLDGWTATGSGTVQRSNKHARFGRWSAKLTPDGDSIFPYLWTAPEGVGDVEAGNRYTASAWVYSPAGYDPVAVALKWCDSSGNRVGQTYGAQTPIPAGQWILLQVTDAAPSNAETVGCWVRMYDTPSTEDVLYLDQAQVTHLNLLQVATTSGPVWTTDDGEFPFTIAVAGEQMLVTDIDGDTSPQEFVVARATNGVTKSHLPGTDVRLANPLATSY